MIRFGHSLSEIMEYSFPQIKLFLEAAATLELEEKRDRLVLGAIASQGDSKTIQSTIRELEGMR